MRKLVLFSSTILLAFYAHAGEMIRFTRAEIDPTQVSFQSSNATHEMIVQFHQAVTEDDKSIFTSKGFLVLGYLPDDALVISGDFSTLGKIKSERIRAIIPYLPEFKISTGVTTLTSASERSEVWIVSLYRESFAGPILKSLDGHPHVEVLTSGGRSVIVRAPRILLKMMASLPGVEHIQADPQFESLHMKALDNQAGIQPAENEVLSGFETGTQAMNFEAAWSQGYTGRGQIVSFADTGLDMGQLTGLHPDFMGGVKAGQGFWSSSSGSNWEDPMGHGTHVAGSIAGRGAHSKGSLRGGAYDSMIVAQSMWSKMMNNIMPPTPITKLFDEAKKEGATIHSDSWGSPRNLGEYDAFSQQVDEWMFNNQDVLLIFAAGNSGVDMNKDGRIDSGSIGSPATAKNCLSVGASENTVSTGGIQVPISQLRIAKDVWSAEPIFSSKISDHIDGVAMFSSRGPTRDGRIKPDVVGPGTNILSTKSLHPKAEDLWGRYNDHYVWSGGTSMSTPLVAGAVTVARQYLVEKMNVAQPSAALLKAVIMHNAVDMYPGQYGEVGAAQGQELLTHRPNSDQGYGRVDVSKIVGMGPQTKVADEKTGIAANQEKVYEFTISEQGSLVANLVYTDAPASPNSAQALVNDLDLVLVKADGSQVAPADRVNNHEFIEISNLAGGNYKLIVKGTKVPQGLNGSQPFALVWTVK